MFVGLGFFSRREFAELLEKFGSQSNTGSARSSPILHGSSEYLRTSWWGGMGPKAPLSAEAGLGFFYPSVILKEF